MGTDPFNTDFLSFAQARIAETNPMLAQESGDPLNELLISGGTTLLEPLAREIWNIRLRQDMSRLDYHTEESMDAAVSKLFLERIIGEYATGTVRVYFAAPRYAAFTMEKIFSTASGLNFYPASNQYITASQMVYNKEGDYYYFDVKCISQNPGIGYNVSPNKIVSVTGIDGVVKVANKVKFRSGVAKETNEQLWSRAAALPNEAAANTYRGLYAVLRENIPAITYFQMAGYGDDEMTRDRIMGGGYGPLAAYTTVIFCVEDGDYDMSSPRIYSMAMPFEFLLGGLGAPPRPAMLSINHTPPGGMLPLQQDCEIISVIDANTVEVDTEFRIDGTFHHMALRYKSLTISGMPQHAYLDTFVSFQVFDSCHIGGCIDVWVKDPEPTEGESLLPSVSDETYFHLGADGELIASTDPAAICLFDVTANEYYSGAAIAYVPFGICRLSDIGSTSDPIPMEMQIGDIIHITSSGVGETGHYKILTVDASNFSPGPGYIEVDIGVALGGALTAYKLVNFSRQLSKGWVVKLEEGEAGLYKMERITDYVDPVDVTRAGVKIRTGTTFSLDQAGLDYKIYDNFEINLAEPKNIRIEAADLTCFGGGHVAVSAAGLDFAVLGVAEGDTLRINTGSNAGDYPIVRYAGATNSELALSVPTPFAEINADYTVFQGLTAVELPLVRVADVNIVDSSESSINVPCADPLACVSRGLSNMDSGSRLRVTGSQVGLVGSVEDGPGYVAADDFAFKIRRRLMLEMGIDEQVQSFTITFGGLFTLASVIQQINTAVGNLGPIAQNVDNHLVLAPLADEGILIDIGNCTGTALADIGFTDDNCVRQMSGAYPDHYVSYGINLINEDRPAPMGESDYVYFETGANAGTMLPWEELPSAIADHVIFDPFCGVHPQPPWETNSTIIGYPSTGYFRCYFKEPTKVTIDPRNVITITDEDGVERGYIPAPKKYALIAPGDPDTDRWEAVGLATNLGRTAALLTDAEIAAFRGLLPKEFGESEYNLLSPRTDVLAVKYRRVWFYEDIATNPWPHNFPAGCWLEMSVDNGPVKRVTFLGVTEAQDVIDAINATWDNVAEIDVDSGPSHSPPVPALSYICLRSQYLISNLVASAGLTGLLGALVPPLATTNKSLNYGAEARLVSIDADAAPPPPVLYLDPDVTFVLEARYTGADSDLDDGGVGTITGDPNIQYELRRYGAQRVSSCAMNSNEHVGYYYADFEYISRGIGDSFNVEPDVTGDMAGSPALGYTLTTDEPLAFSTMEPVRMVITPTVSEVDVTSKASDDRVISDDLKIAYLYSEVAADAHNVLVQELERILCGSIVCKHMIPYFVNADISYTGGPSEADALAEIEELIEGLREGTRLEVSDVTNILTNRGASYVQTPIVLAVLAQDTNRKQKLYLIEDSSTLSRLAAFYMLNIELIRS